MSLGSGARRARAAGEGWFRRPGCADFAGRWSVAQRVVSGYIRYMDFPTTHLPRIDFGAAGAVDAGRLERSLDLHCLRVAPGRYRVSGGTQTHWVDLYTASLPRCDCGDHLWRERVCKHILAGLLREGNEHVLTALKLLVHRLRGTSRAA